MIATTARKVAREMKVLPRLTHLLTDMTELDLDVNLTEMRVLLAIDSMGSQPMSAYSHAVGLQRGSFTTVTDKLEEKGLLERRADASDRRQVRLTLTQVGEEWAQECREAFETHIEKRLAPLDQDQLTQLNGALETLGAILKRLEESR